jgi:hypothetical protein
MFSPSTGCSGVGSMISPPNACAWIDVSSPGSSDE